MLLGDILHKSSCTYNEEFGSKEVILFRYHFIMAEANVFDQS